jgi:hypothetical protein
MTTTAELYYNGMSVDEGVEHVMNQITPGQIVYARSPVNMKFAGFPALGDLLDHNMLLPFTESFDANNAELLEFLDAVIQGVTKAIMETGKR